jgi:SAM-dependent methyltransferase
MTTDVPSSLDYRRMEDALQWAGTTPKRPWREEFFATFAEVIAQASEGRRFRVLELGSGPGFLAETLLSRLPAIEYVGLDFSAAMHELARSRLGPLATRASFVERSLKEADWSQGLGQFDFVVTNQTVHELRHKRHAAGLHAQVRPLLVPGGSYLVCDHFFGEGGMSNEQLYMTAAEQRGALLDAGFSRVEQLLLKGDLVLHRAA